MSISSTKSICTAFGGAITHVRAALTLPAVGGGCFPGRPPGPAGSSRETVRSLPDRFATAHGCWWSSHLFYGQLFEPRQGAGEEADYERGGGADDV